MKKIAFLLVLFTTLITSVLKSQNSGNAVVSAITQFNPNLFIDKYKAEALLIDVRPKSDFKIAHLKGAISLDAMATNLAQQTMKFKKERNFFIYGSSVEDSKKAAEVIANLGFPNIYYLNGEFADLVKVGMPVEK